VSRVNDQPHLQAYPFLQKRVFFSFNLAATHGCFLLDSTRERTPAPSPPRPCGSFSQDRQVFFRSVILRASGQSGSKYRLLWASSPLFLMRIVLLFPLFPTFSAPLCLAGEIWGPPLTNTYDCDDDPSSSPLRFSPP